MPIPYVRPEILDHIINFLHDERETLMECCLVSKSWVPRIRRKLFAEIKIRSKRDLKLWKKVFPDVANSPACHVRTLFVGCLECVVESDAGEGGWIRAFSSVDRLDVDNDLVHLDTSTFPLTPFHGFSSTLKSLRVGPLIFLSPQFFHLVRSSPLLEDLTVKGRDESSIFNNYPHQLPPDVPLTSPPLTGSLDLNIHGGMGNTVRRLLDLPNGLRFRKLKLSWNVKKDLQWIMVLVEGTSQTIELLHITCSLGGTSICHPQSHR